MGDIIINIHNRSIKSSLFHARLDYSTLHVLCALPLLCLYVCGQYRFSCCYIVFLTSCLASHSSVVHLGSSPGSTEVAARRPGDFRSTRIGRSATTTQNQTSQAHLLSEEANPIEVDLSQVWLLRGKRVTMFGWIAW